MIRRDFITLLGGGAAAWPLAARAQQPERVLRIGVLLSFDANDPERWPRAKALQEGLGKLGWIDDRNVRVEYRSTADEAERRSFAKELVGLQPQVLVAGSTASLAALLRETRTIPIVFVNVADPVGQGFISSLARPAGNVTGFTIFEFSMGAKWLELLKEVAPHTARVSIIFNPDIPPATLFLRSVETAAQSFALKLIPMPIKDAAEIEGRIEAFARQPNGGLIVLPDIFSINHRHLYIASVAHRGLPTMYPYRFCVTEGGLISYGSDNLDPYRQAAKYVDVILKGAKPGELPVQAPTKFELVINLKTAKALGLDVPPTLLARADEVIE
jgi:putative tryptophan/tyrosine transport system substrate-binding protein